MRRFLLYLMAVIMLALTVALGWWTLNLQPPDARTYRVQPGDTPAEVARDLGVAETELARANGMDIEKWTLVPGTEILVPERPQTAADKLGFHVLGLGCMLIGLLAGLMLAIAAGLLPSPVRGQAAAMALVLALTSYFFSRAVLGEVDWLSPQLAFEIAKDGFAWAAVVALLARAIGIREARPPEGPTDVANVSP